MIKVGCCGFQISKKKYYGIFNLVEVQESFYNLPNVTRMEKWRKEAPPDFEFTMKAWQVITHPKTSPTWRRIKTDVWGNPDNYGLLRPTKENLRAWEKTLEVADALKASVIILQLPPKLELNESTYSHIYEFLSRIDMGGHMVAIEPRNKTWDRNRERMKHLFQKFNIIHCVDIFKRDPLRTGNAFYIRLHGLNGEINYSYRYTDEDLKRLRMLVKNLEKYEKDIYVLFNNIYMIESASKFKEVLKS